MSLTPARNYTRLAVAIVIAAVVVSASILSYSSFEATVTRTGATEISTATTTLTVVDISSFATTVTRTQTMTCIEGAVTSSTIVFEAPGTTNPVASVIPSNSTDNCQLGVTLDVAASPTVSVGQNETVYVSLSNDLATPNNVNYTGLPALPYGFVPNFGITGDYTLPISDGCLWSSSVYEPAFIAVYNESGAPVQLNGSPPSISYCPAIPNYHSFNASQTITETLRIGGSWRSSNTTEPWLNATYNKFSPGNYTVIAFDPWGQLARLNFTVLPASLDYLSVSCSSLSFSYGAFGPCWGSEDAYVFDCAASAATTQGCTQVMTSTVPPYPNYTLNVRYPFANQTTREINQSEPSSINCLWTVQGITPEQGYALCIPIDSTSFVIGEPAGPNT